MDMLSMHKASCNKENNSTTRQSPVTLYNMPGTYESPSAYPASVETSPYIRPESANILASSYTCGVPFNNDSSIDTVSSLDTIYIQPQIVDVDYNRPDSVLSLPPNSETGYVTTDGFIPKSTNLLVPIDPEQEYYDPEVNYNLQTQQCHTYPSTLSDTQSKLNNGLNDGCLV